MVFQRFSLALKSVCLFVCFSSENMVSYMIQTGKITAYNTECKRCFLEKLWESSINISGCLMYLFCWYYHFFVTNIQSLASYCFHLFQKKVTWKAFAGYMQKIQISEPALSLWIRKKNTRRICEIGALSSHKDANLNRTSLQMQFLSLFIKRINSCQAKKSPLAEVRKEQCIFHVI